MRASTDKLQIKILKLLHVSPEPLETKEIELALETTRIKTLYRLNLLRGDQKICGKPMGSGKGVWVWWRKNAF